MKALACECFFFMARNSILWKYQDSMGTHIYLLGTIHLNSSNIEFRRHELKELILAIEQVYTETEIDKISENRFQQYLMLPEDNQVSDYLSVRNLERFSIAINKFTGLNLHDLGRFQPLIIQNIIAQRLLQENGGESPDEFVHNYSSLHNIQIKGIETSDEQLKILREIDIEYQFVLLKRFLSDLSGTRKKLQHQIRLYNEGRVHQLYAMGKKSLGMLKQLMLYQRNENMVERITRLEPGKNYLIAVGAAHLSGGKGILHGCHQQGMTFKPI